MGPEVIDLKLHTNALGLLHFIFQATSKGPLVWLAKSDSPLFDIDARS